MILLLRVRRDAGRFPSGGYQSSTQHSPVSPTSPTWRKHLFLPCLTLTLGYIGEYAIIMRSSLIEVMDEEFIQTARAKGVRDERFVATTRCRTRYCRRSRSSSTASASCSAAPSSSRPCTAIPGLGLLEFQAIESAQLPGPAGVFLLSSADVIRSTWSPTSRTVTSTPGSDLAELSVTTSDCHRGSIAARTTLGRIAGCDGVGHRRLRRDLPTNLDRHGRTHHHDPLHRAGDYGPVARRPTRD